MSSSDEAEESIRASVLLRARQHADKMGWTWREPVSVARRRGKSPAEWQVSTNSHAIGCAVHMTIRESDLAILSAVFHPR